MSFLDSLQELCSGNSAQFILVVEFVIRDTNFYQDFAQNIFPSLIICYCDNVATLFWF